MADKQVKITFEVDGIKQSVNSVDELTEALKDAGDASKETQDEMKGLASENGFIAEQVGRVKDTFKGLKGDLKNATAGIKSFFKSGVTGSKLLKVGLASLGIGLIITAVASLVSYFQNFEVVTKTVQKALNGLGAIFGQLGKSFAALIKGDFKGAANAFKDIGSAVSEAAANTDKLFEANKRLNGIQQQNVIQSAKLRQEIEGYKKILEDSTQSEQDRLAALDEVTKRTKQLAEAQLEENQVAQDALEAQIALTNNEVERRDLELELAQLRAERIDQQTELNNIEFDAAKVGREIRLAAEEERQALLEKKKEEEAKAAEEAAAKAAEEKAEADKKAQEELDRQKALDAEIQTLEEEKLIREAENQFRAAEQELAILEQKEIDRLALLGASEEQLQMVREKFSGKRKQLAKEEQKFNQDLDQAELDAKIQVAQAAFSAIASIAGEQSVVGKAAAVANATINTYLAATNALANTPAPPPFPQIAAGVAIASGLLQVKQILTTKVPGEEGGGAGGGVAAPRLAGPSAPAVDPTAAVAAAAEGQEINNQIGIAEARTGGTVKAYVVAEEMTSSQEANKKIDELASL